jgi:hypothetical protein
MKVREVITAMWAGSAVVAKSLVNDGFEWGTEGDVGARGAGVCGIR